MFGFQVRGAAAIAVGPGGALCGELVLYTRSGCHLCAEADAVLAPVLRASGRTLRRVDVARNAAAEAVYGDRVPVLVCGTREICWGRFDAAALRGAFGVDPPGRRRPFWRRGR